ncbi:MAG: YfcE family phosphodiesterase [Oscillospiraceae bacterium]|nr:YfcE family phosphodiesterase [Oscillospiraceae bacterium]
MRIVVFSDSHTRTERLEQIVRAQPDADYYIHLGDGWTDAQRLRAAHPGIRLLTVRGNCDYGCTDADTKELVAGGKRILYTHGHSYNVKYTLDYLRDEAKKRGADVVLYGHTHLQDVSTFDGVYFVNPGAAAQYGGAQFAMVDILPDGDIVCVPAKLKP